MKVKITKASSPVYWYADKIGEEFFVEESSAFPDKFFAGHSTGWIEKEDTQLLSWGIDGAWDNVESNSSPSYYTYPATKEIVVKKSVEQHVSELFNNFSGKNITPEEVVRILELIEILKKMETV